MIGARKRNPKQVDLTSLDFLPYKLPWVEPPHKIHDFVYTFVQPRCKMFHVFCYSGNKYSKECGISIDKGGST